MDNRIKKIADYYGFSSQADMLCEEAAEFIVARNKLRRADKQGYMEVRDSYENVKEELADVIICAEQIHYLLGKDVDCLIDEKLSRQIRRMKKEQAKEQENEKS